MGNKKEDDNKIRPSKGAMWYMEMTDNCFDLDFDNMFSGMNCTAQGFIKIIKAYITKQYDKKIRSMQIMIGTNKFIANLDDTRFETLEDIMDISKKMVTVKRLTGFQVSKDKKFLTFEILGHLKHLDIFSKNETKKQIRFENLYARAEQLGVPLTMNDSSADEWCEYMFEKYFTSAETKKKNGFVILKKWEDFGECEKDVDYSKKTSKKTSKSKENKAIHKGEHINSNDIAPLGASNSSNTNGQSDCDWEVIKNTSSLLSLRHKRTQQPLQIIDTDIINDQSLTLQEKVTEHTLKLGKADRYADVPF